MLILITSTTICFVSQTALILKDQLCSKQLPTHLLRSKGLTLENECEKAVCVELVFCHNHAWLCTYQAVGSSKPKSFQASFCEEDDYDQEARQKKAMLYIGFYFSSSSSTLFLVPTSSYCSSAYGEAVRRNFLHSMRVLLNIGTSGIGAKYIG